MLPAHFAKEDEPDTIIPKVSHNALAEIVGATRSRIKFLLNNLRKQGA
ncbi:hypothetical protein ACO9S2_00500 [Nitrospira sp. NS4]